MLKKILVTYASRTGSTKGVAEAIGTVLEEEGTQVDVLPMKEVKNLDQYNSVVAGSAINDNKWLPEAMKFIETHQTELLKKRFAAFTVCITLALTNGEKYMEGVMGWLEPVRNLVKPISEGFFAGQLDIEKIPSFKERMMFRLSVRMGVWKEGDHRDWKVIRAWAESLRKVL